jgi:hypothetical protein
MAKKGTATEPKQDRMSIFAERLMSFDLHAPLRSWKVDRFLESLSSRRKLSLDVLGIRREIWQAAYTSVLDHIYVKSEHPAWVSEAREFLKCLADLRSTIASVRRFDVEHLSRVLIHFADGHLQLRDDEHYEAVESSTTMLLECLAKVDIRLESYLDRKALPIYSTPGNRADHFIRSFAQRSAETWRRQIAPVLDSKRDRRDFVGLLATALDDLKYPRAGKQMNSDDWLYQRVGTYDIWK